MRLWYLVSSPMNDGLVMPLPGENSLCKEKNMFFAASILRNERIENNTNR